MNIDTQEEKKRKTTSSYIIISDIIENRYLSSNILLEKKQIIEALALRRYCIMKDEWLKKNFHSYGSEQEQLYCERNFSKDYFKLLIEYSEQITEEHLKIICDSPHPSNDNSQKPSWLSKLSSFLSEHKLIISLFFIFLSILCIGIFPKLHTTVENCFKYAIDKMLTN